MTIYKKFIVSILFTLAVLLFSDGYMNRSVWGAESEIDEIVFSLDVRDKPLSGVLRIIYEQTGYNFLITEAAKNLPVTISLSKAPLQKGLNQVINSAGIGNHAVVFDRSKNVFIIIIDGLSLASNVTEMRSGYGNIQDARAEKPHLIESEKNTIAMHPPTEIFPRSGQDNSQQKIVTEPPKEVYDMRYHTRQ
jgi:hypothetical protein